ncbi:hypothetical protein MHU86_19111 [Fragilaria crotonensis]|nr:hypothetical protein MHU86_19111 [Fragilaria crotonensis]
MENSGSADDVAKDAARDGIQEHELAEELSSDLPSTATPSSAPFASPPYASLSSPSAAKVDDREIADGAGRVGDTKNLEHALPTDPRMQLPAGLGMVDSMGRPPVVYASNDGVGPGAFPVVPSFRNTATSRIVRSPIGSYDSPREFIDEESDQGDGVPNSAAVGSALYTVEAQRVPDGNEDGTVLVAEAQYVRTKWYQRRWIVVGSILCACGLVIVVVVILVFRPSTAATSSSSLTSPTPAPTVLTPELIACAFLFILDATECRSTFEFNNRTTGSAIPSEIGLLTQLTYLDFSNNLLISTIPSEIGLLTKLTVLDFSGNSLTSTIPSEMGLLTQLTFLDISSNSLTSTIPSEIGLLTQLTLLSFNYNSLTSTISSEMGLLTQLTYLDISSNALTSTIPSEIGLLTTLTWVDLSVNQFTSTIPSEIGLLTKLTWLDFESNSLTSTIPREIGLLTLLEYLNFSNHTLTGTIPSSLCSLPSLVPYIVIDCGEITCASGCCSGWDADTHSSFSCG